MRFVLLLCLMVVYVNGEIGAYHEVQLDDAEKTFCRTCLISLRQILVFPSRKAYYPYSRILVCNPVPIRKAVFEAIHYINQYNDCQNSFFPRSWTFSYVHDLRFVKEGEIFRNGTYYIRNGRKPDSDRYLPHRLSSLDYYFDRSYLKTIPQLQATFKKAEIFHPYKEMRDQLEEHLRLARRLAGFALMG